MNVGTNGGTAWTRPSTVPTGSGTVLVNHTDYNAAGLVQDTIDPRGIIAGTFYDLLGRQLKTVAAWDGTQNPTPTNSTNQITQDTYDGNGDVLTLTAVQPSGGSTPNQTTGYVYGVGGTIGQNIFSNSLVAATEYPDPSTGQPSSSYGDEEQFGYNWQGEKTSYVMRDTTTHRYLHDVLGRLTADTVSSFGGNVDQTIQRLGYSFNDAGLPFQQTSYSDAAGTTIANQVQDAYNGYGQLTDEYQSHSGAVVVGSSLETKYAYLQPAGANYSRLSAMTYPNGQVLDYAYGVQEPISSISSSGTTATATYSGPNQFSVGDQIVINGAASSSPYNGTFTIAGVNTSSSTFTFTLGSSYTGSDSSADLTALKPSADSLDNAISRISAIQDHAGTYAGNDQSYQYLGLSTIVQELDANGIELTYIKQSGEPNGDGGDPYTGLDRFGRVDDQRWIPVSNPNNAVDRFQYGYDQNGNVLYKNNLVNSSFSELYHANSTTSGDDNTAYDALDRLTYFSRGTLSASGHNGSTFDTITSPSTTNSWSLDALGNWTATQNGSQTRTFNAQNQMTSISGQSNSFYENGDMVSDPLGNRQFYDAWNRMVKGDSLGINGGGYEITSFDALGRMIYDPTTNVDLYYNTSANAVEERQGGSEVRQYVWGLGYVNNLAVVSDGVGGPRFYAHQDANWNITSLTDPSGAVSQRMIYDPYGSETYFSPTWASGGNYATLLYGFQGGRIQGTFVHFGARSYNPSLGAWMEADPAMYVSGANLYQSVNDNPVATIDPSGLAGMGDGAPVLVPSPGGGYDIYGGNPFDPTHVRHIPARDTLQQSLINSLSPQQQNCPTCVQEAKDLADSIDKAVASQTPQIGGILGDYMSAWFGWGNQCGDWQQLVMNAAKRVTDAYGNNSCFQTWTVDASTTKTHQHGFTHNWVEIRTASGGVTVVDPYPSGGAELVDPSHTGGWKTYWPVKVSPFPRPTPSAGPTSRPSCNCPNR